MIESQNIKKWCKYASTTSLLYVNSMCCNTRSSRGPMALGTFKISNREARKSSFGISDESIPCKKDAFTKESES